METQEEKRDDIFQKDVIPVEKSLTSDFQVLSF